MTRVNPVLRITPRKGIPSVLGDIGISGSNGSFSAQTVTFGNSNGVSFYTTNGSLVASVVGGGGGGAVLAAGSQTGNTSGTVVFSNSNGITFGMSNSSVITASHNGITTGRASTDGLGLNTAGTNITWTANSNGVSINAGGYAGTGFTSTTTAGVDIKGTNNTAGLSIAVPAFLTTAQAPGAYLTTAAQSNQVVNSLNGSTGQVSLTVASSLSFSSNGSTISFGLASNITTALQSAGAYLTTAALSNHSHGFSADGGSSTFQTLSFSNRGGVSFTNSNGQVAASVKTDYALSDHSHGNPTLNLTNLSGTTASNSNGFTLSLSAAAGGGGADGGNVLIAGTRTAGSNSSVLFSNANGITFGLDTPNGSIMTASYTVPTVTNSSWTVSDNATSATVGRLAFTQANGITMSLSTSNNGNHTVFASHNGITTGRASNDAVGLNTALTAGPLAWTVNSSGISLNASSAAGTTSGFGGNLISGSMTHNTAGLNLSLNHPAWLTTAMQSNAATISNINISAGTTSTNASNFTFANGNGISFGLGTGASVGSITASHNGLTTARASNDAIGLNTAQSNVTWTVNSSGLSLDARGYAGTGTSKTGNAAITLNSNGLQFNGASLAGTTTGFAGANISGSMTHNTDGLNLSLSVAAPGAAAENNWVNLLGANTAGNTTASGSTIGYSGINITLSGTNNSVVNISAPATSSLVGSNGVSISTNGSTISIMKPLISEFVPYTPISTNSQTLGVLGNSTASARFFPIEISDNVAFNVLSLMHFLSYQTSSVSGRQTISYLYGLYSENAASLSLISSSSFSLAVTNSSVSHTVSYPVSTGTGGYTYTTLSQSTTANIQSFWGTAAAGRPIGFQFGNSVTLSSGDYWLGLLLRHSSSSANVGISFALVGNANSALNNVAGIGQASSAQTTNYSIRFGNRALGAYTVSQSSLPNGVAFSQIAHTQTILPLYSFLST